MKITSYLSIAAFALFCVNAASQGQTLPKTTTFILPDGKTLSPDKIDSLENAWGKGRIMFRHDEEDDRNGVMHLVRKTDKQADQDTASKNALSSMLNKPAPLFELTDLQGKKWNLQQLRGKKVVLNFWFTSCAPCIHEMPELNKLAAEYKGKDVVFLGLTFSSAAQVNAFLKKHKFDYTLLAGSKEIDKKYQIYTWPTSMVIDRKGIIRHIETSGAAIGNKLKKAIDTIK